jgi:hypothetical protein
MFFKAYNEEREHDGINDHAYYEMFLMKGRLNHSVSNKKIKQIKMLPILISESVIYFRSI